MRLSFPEIRSDFLHAVQFLTRLPVGPWITYDPGTPRRSVFYFPLVGAAIGLAGGLAYTFFASGFPQGLAILGAMFVQVAITGGLHEDGLCDAADGLCGHASRERALEIMRDSRIGTYGALALAFVLAERFEALGSFDASRFGVASALVAAAAIGRACGVALLSTAPNARAESATSRPFSGGLPPQTLAWCLGGTMLFTLPLLGFDFRPFIAAASATFALRAFFINRIGGITGDCLGATIALAEIAALVAHCSPFNGLPGMR